MEIKINIIKIGENLHTCIYLNNTPYNEQLCGEILGEHYYVEYLIFGIRGNNITTFKIFHREDGLQPDTEIQGHVEYLYPLEETHGLDDMIQNNFIRKINVQNVKHEYIVFTCKSYKQEILTGPYYDLLMRAFKRFYCFLFQKDSGEFNFNSETKTVETIYLYEIFFNIAKDQDAESKLSSMIYKEAAITFKTHKKIDTLMASIFENINNLMLE